MTTVGILGGGQLARMLALAGAPLGLHFRVLDVSGEACAGQFAPLIVADYTDQAALARFASEVDVVTFDFENVPAQSAAWLAERLPVYPNPNALALAQDRLAEKRLFAELGLATPAFAVVDDHADLLAATQTIGFPCILKTRRLGYDGKGQVRLKSAADIDPAWAELGHAPLILEAFVAFERELSVLAVRGRDGEFRSYPLTQNWHRQGVLSASLAPASVAAGLAAKAVAAARAIAERLDYVGVFALELFDCGGQLLANEMAPRVHNSGHWTIEGADCSQFANHLRAVLGLPLGSTTACGVSVMLNWVGELPDRCAILSSARGYFHDYGKSPRAGRKVGHATLTSASAAELAPELARVAAALGREAEFAPALAALR
ncbi:MAG: 5-(carboxyamino)imidazole ribonucleotide synthase [Lysobacterales bacterium]